MDPKFEMEMIVVWCDSPKTFRFSQDLGPQGDGLFGAVLRFKLAGSFIAVVTGSLSRG